VNKTTLTLRSLRYHWRANTAAALAAAVGTAVLVGALLVGDSVRHSLKTMVVERLGKVDAALLTGERFVHADMAKRLDDAASAPRHVPFILLSGVCANDATNQAAGQVQAIGVPQEFGQLGGHWPTQALNGGEAFVNECLARSLGVKAGDTLRVRLSKPGAMSYDAPLGPDARNTALLRATVKAVLPDRGLGRFGFAANQAAPLNVYLPLAEVQEKVGQKGRANVIAQVGAPAAGTTESTGSAWTLDDLQLRLRVDAKLGFIELSSARVFLDEPVCDALLNDKRRTTNHEPTAVLTYFVNAIRANGRETPYSMVTAGEAPLVPADLKDDEIVLNAWTAEDLNAKPGDKVELEYFTLGLLRKLESHKAAFTVKAIVPLEGLHADKHLMPDFPGIADVDTTHEWDSSIPIDLKKIRDKDEEYWKKHRGTPKAFITLKRGAELWRTRFGTYTALRFPLKQGEDAEARRVALDKHIRETVGPAAVGLTFTPVRAQALKAADQAMDFGGLFLGFSFFLIVAALLLMALLFQFNVDARANETGLLLALGFAPRSVRLMLWTEGVVLAALGSVAGAAGGTVYAQWLLHMLATRWRDAVGTSALEYHAEPASLLIGYVAGVAAAAVTVFLAVRRQASLNARELLAASPAESPYRPMHCRAGLYVAGVCVVAALGIVAAALAGSISAAGAFFGAGALLLVAAITGARVVLSERRGPPPAPSRKGRGSLAVVLARLGIRACARRGTRSLGTVALLACGAFLLVAVGANQQDAGRDAERKESGTGGFALAARSTFPVYEDLNTQTGRGRAGVAEAGLSGVTIYPFRVKDGDEASCLNLNRAQQPRVLGVPAAFIARGGFTFVAQAGAALENPWTMLNGAAGEAIPAVCDFQSLTWALGKKVGDELTLSDEQGRTRRVRIVGAVANSILQGSILIAEEEFLKLYPSESGYREFLIDAPPDRTEAVAQTLNGALRDEGFRAAPAVQRLAEFNAVQNTYLATFQALGALGMLLGSLGLGIVVLRNVLERRGELAVLRAVGFSRAQIGWLILSEHAWLVVLGLGAGVVPSLVAVLPALHATMAPVPWGAIGTALGTVAAFALCAAWLATWAMLRAPLLPALRNE
jgi:ABC-type antimicrobial peptide transport system permease subunit